MIGVCKKCGFRAGIFNLKNGLCRSCRDSLPEFENADERADWNRSSDEKGPGSCNAVNGFHQNGSASIVQKNVAVNSSTLQTLLQDLETKTRLNVGGGSLPDEGIVKQIGELHDPAALPALYAALERVWNFESLSRRLESGVNPTVPGSASFLLGEILAKQTAETIEAAIAKCKVGEQVEQDTVDFTPAPPSMNPDAESETNRASEDTQPGADSTARNQPNKDDLLAAIIACDDSRVIEMLDAGLSPNGTDEENNPLLNIACQRGKVSIVNSLLQYGADINGTNSFGTTALIAGVLLNNDDIVSFLLSKNADVDVVAQGETAFSLAEKTGYISGMELLLSHLPNFSMANTLIGELVALGQGGYPETGYGYLSRNNTRTIEIGTELDNCGGIKLMLFGLAKIRKEHGNVAARELEMAWDGIGEWLG